MLQQPHCCGMTLLLRILFADVYAAGFSFCINLFTNKHPLVAEVFIYRLIQHIPLDRIFCSLVGDSHGMGVVFESPVSRLEKNRRLDWTLTDMDRKLEDW